MKEQTSVPLQEVLEKYYVGSDTSEVLEDLQNLINHLITYPWLSDYTVTKQVKALPFLAVSNCEVTIPTVFSYPTSLPDTVGIKADMMAGRFLVDTKTKEIRFIHVKTKDTSYIHVKTKDTSYIH